MTEARLRTAIVKMLQTHSGWWVVTHGGPYQESGLPDIIGCYRGIMFGLEVKLPGKEHTLTVKQSRTLAKIRQAGGKATMVTSVNDAMDFVFNSPL